jgi:hypothetical protein
VDYGNTRKDSEMKVRFVTKCEIEIFDSFDEALDDGETSDEIFDVGDITYFNLLDPPLRFDGKGFIPDKDNVNVQFDDGSVAFGISRTWFEEIVE